MAESTFRNYFLVCLSCENQDECQTMHHIISKSFTRYADKTHYESYSGKVMLHIHLKSGMKRSTFKNKIPQESNHQIELITHKGPHNCFIDNDPAPQKKIKLNEIAESGNLEPLFIIKLEEFKREVDEKFEKQKKEMEEFKNINQQKFEKVDQCIFEIKKNGSETKKMSLINNIKLSKLEETSQKVLEIIVERLPCQNERSFADLPLDPKSNSEQLKPSPAGNPKKPTSSVSSLAMGTFAAGHCIPSFSRPKLL